MSIKIEHLNYVYSEGTAYEKHALKDICLEIPHGEFVGIIGHTGSGKSTLIQHLNGLIKGTSGAIYYNGENIYQDGYDMRALRSQVGLVFQYPEHQLFEIDVLTDVCFGPKNQGLSQQECEARALEALKLVGLKEKYYKSSPFELSGGQKRRVAIAGVLAMRPKVLVLDEPTAALTQPEVEELFKIMNDLRDKGIGMIYISHRMDEINRISDRVTVMRDGEYIGTVNTKDTTKDEIVRMMVGRVIYGDKKEKSAVPQNAETVLEVKHLNACRTDRNGARNIRS